MDRQKLKIASPCSQNFDEMAGEGHRRFCDSCEKHVHNLSDLTKAEALALLKENTDGGVCVVYTFDASNRVRFREEMGFRRPSKAQLRGVKRLLAAAAIIPILAALPACDPAPDAEEISILEGYGSVAPCDLPNQSGARPIDAIIAAEQRFVANIKELLGFVPEYEMVAGAPMVDPSVYEIVDGVPQLQEEPVFEEPYPTIVGEVAYEPTPEILPDVEPEPEPEPEPGRAVPIVERPIEQIVMGDMEAPTEAIDALERDLHGRYTR